MFPGTSFPADTNRTELICQMFEEARSVRSERGMRRKDGLKSRGIEAGEKW